ncbi:hypothetical protein NQ315_008820 [Exocentrus adspersus]|uniref:Integrase catalytic domain-containing protein n=1 Tax=Exocentrus adspersus TaxID=1586481 RepID=A0AAV8VCA9_9CUCU|nr:hypothetical protein NQ315_008820 [Exocentrus adspersus]
MSNSSCKYYKDIVGKRQLQTVEHTLMQFRNIQRNDSEITEEKTDSIDVFTKWVEAEAVLRATHVEVIAFVDSIAARFGYPAVIITDNGGVFRSAQWERYLQEKHVEAYFAPIYHQRANPVERRVQELKKVLRVNRVETHRWDQHLSEALFSLRTRKNAATGQTASELVYGENLKRPGEWTIPPEVVPPQEHNQEIRRQRLQQARRRQEVYARNLFPEPREAGTKTIFFDWKRICTL